MSDEWMMAVIWRRSGCFVVFFGVHLYILWMSVSLEENLKIFRNFSRILKPWHVSTKVTQEKKLSLEKTKL